MLRAGLKPASVGTASSRNVSSSSIQSCIYYNTNKMYPNRGVRRQRGARRHAGDGAHGHVPVGHAPVHRAGEPDDEC